MYNAEIVSARVMSRSGAPTMEGSAFSGMDRSYLGSLSGRFRDSFGDTMTLLAFTSVAAYIVPQGERPCQSSPQRSPENHIRARIRFCSNPVHMHETRYALRYRRARLCRGNAFYASSEAHDGDAAPKAVRRSSPISETPPVGCDQSGS